MTADSGNAGKGLLVRRLAAHDAPAYRALMLEAYEQAADAFTSTAEERRAEPTGWWIARIGSSADQGESFGAFLAGELVGTVAIEYSSKPKTRHSALVIGMYVTASARRFGAARQLLQALVAAAAQRPGVELLRLTVTEGNAPAIRLYESMGFAAWGVEPLAIRTPGGLRGKVHMMRRLGAPIS